tara:strand:- start:80461 stop:80823 length:363 start_codon:yes stop_codon:yes gene_type:complete
MNITHKVRLEFRHVFPKEEEEPIINYLREIPFEFLMKIIGFSNTPNPPDHNNFFSDPKLKISITQAGNKLIFLERFDKTPVVTTPLGSLHLAEKILANIEELRPNNSRLDIKKELALVVF